MIRPPTGSSVARPPLRGICLVVADAEKAANSPDQGSATPGTATGFPQRSDARYLSESIPRFFIARNKTGLWVVREVEGRTGGIFVFKWSAVRFARKNSAPRGCAIVFLAHRFELDVENQGSRLAIWLDALRRGWRKLIPDYPPPMPIGRRPFKGEWR